MKLVSKTDPILNSVCHPVDFNDLPFDMIEFAHDLVKCMYDSNGIGLSANQVGVPYRIFSMRGSPENFVCINPRVVNPSEEQVYLEEGCLSYPGLMVKIKRPRHIRVRFNTPNGDTRTETFTGMTARCFLHEMDHMDGNVFYKHATDYHRHQALNKMKKFERRLKR
jgi:peptide deformylase